MNSGFSHLLRFLDAGKAFALLEDTRNSAARPAARLFLDAADEIIVREAQGIEAALTAIEAAAARGLHPCGYLSYECGYHFQDRQRFDFRHCRQTDLPLLHFHVFRRCVELSAERVLSLLGLLGQGEEVAIHAAQFDIGPTEYTRCFERIRQLIHAGDIYQLNFTAKQDFSYSGTPLALYKALRKYQKVGYGAFLNFAEARILSFSPELFLRREGTTLLAQPMKGTLAAADDPATLARDAKNRAENLMIVDLLRNDIGRIAEPGSVSATQLFNVESYETLHQMTSTVSGRIAPDTDLGTVLRNLFPCGSVTGAPKIRSMEIIEQIEEKPRGIHTGAIGFLSPERDFCFNVAIRTILSRRDGHAEMGVGSGIVADSEAGSEYAECVLKSRFLGYVNSEFDLVESMLCEHGQIAHLDLHINRLAASAMFFGFHFNRSRLLAMVWDAMMERSDGARRIRLSLNREGEARIEKFAVERPPQGSRPFVEISQYPIDGASVFRRHKTSKRELYEAEYQHALANGAYEVLFFNQYGFLAEASRHNVLLELDGQLYTPPLEDGALPGIMRHILLNRQDRRLQEKHLDMEDLRRAERIVLCNAVRGEIEVSLPANHRPRLAPKLRLC